MNNKQDRHELSARQNNSKNHEKIDISVIVPFYNSERYIKKCIEGLIDQNYPADHYEIIMVDNNSTDSAIEIISRYPQIKLIHELKQGSYAARNRGIRESNGKIIAFTDADCLPSGNWLNEIELALADPDVEIVIGYNQLAGDSLFLSMLENYENEKNNYISNTEIKELYYGYTRNMAVRKKLFDEAGLFLDRQRGSDFIFIHKCIDKYSYKVVRYSPQIRVRHLEVNSATKFFRKCYIYGSSIRMCRQVVNARPLTTRERFLIFRKTAEINGYSRIKTVLFLALLFIGYIYWVSGSAGAALKPGDKKKLNTR